MEMETKSKMTLSDVPADVMDSALNKIVGLFQKCYPDCKITASDVKEMLVMPLMDIDDAMDDEEMKETPAEAKKEDKMEAPMEKPSTASNPFSDSLKMM